jgi:hypothetical protein
MAGGSSRPRQLLEHFKDKILLLAVDRDDSRLQDFQPMDDDLFQCSRTQIDENFRLASILEEKFERNECDVLIAKKALHELPWKAQRNVIADIGRSVSPCGSVVLYADSPRFMDDDTMVDWADRDHWLRKHLPMDGADDSPEVRGKLFPPSLEFDPNDASSAAVFINYWIKIKDWANYNAFEWANRFFSSANQLKDAFTKAGFGASSETGAFYMEIQAKRFVEEAINRLGYLYVDKSVQKEELEGVFSQNHRYPLFWQFAEAHLWKDGRPTAFGESVHATMDRRGVQDLIPEAFLRGYGSLKFPDLSGPSFQMPIHIFKFRRPS